MTYGECFETDSCVYISLTVIVLTMVLPCTAISPDTEILLLMKKVEKLRNITQMSSQNYNATLKALSLAKQWQLSTDLMAAKATSDMQQVMAKTTAEAVNKAAKDSNKCWNKLVLARTALEDAEAKLNAAKLTLALVNAKITKNSKSNGSAVVDRVLTIVAALIVVTLHRLYILFTDGLSTV